jgi:hypothetical protein
MIRRKISLFILLVMLVLGMGFAFQPNKLGKLRVLRKEQSQLVRCLDPRVLIGRDRVGRPCREEGDELLTEKLMKRMVCLLAGLGAVAN